LLGEPKIFEVKVRSGYTRKLIAFHSRPATVVTRSQCSSRSRITRAFPWCGPPMSRLWEALQWCSKSAR